MLGAWGRFVYRKRWAVLAVSGVLLGLSIVAIFAGGTFSSGNDAFGKDLPAGQASRLINTQIQGQKQAAGSSFLVIFSSDSLKTTDPAFQSAVKAAIAPLQSDPRVVHTTTPYDVDTSTAQGMTSKDGREALVVVDLKDNSPAAQKYYKELRGKIHSGVLRVVGTGNVPINLAFQTTLEADLQRAEYLALPVTLILLVLIFASVV